MGGAHKGRPGPEKAGEQNIFGGVTHVTRKGRDLGPDTFTWWFFKTVWIRIIPLRRTFSGIAGKLSSKRRQKEDG